MLSILAKQLEQLIQQTRRRSPTRPSRPRTGRRRVGLEVLEDRSVPAAYFVTPNGSDFFGNGSQAAPFQSIQRAVNQAVSGDVIQVAAGTYTYAPSQDSIFASFGTTAVVDVVQKESPFWVDSAPRTG